MSRSRRPGRAGGVAVGGGAGRHVAVWPGVRDGAACADVDDGRREMDALVDEAITIMTDGSEGATSLDREAVKIIGYVFGAGLDCENRRSIMKLLHETKPTTRLHELALEMLALAA
ncbi:hypothetical protein T492DRAFT_893179 [Pavlovales sp. CCMP2436]|nr:hypothetical protein T492DRAFT_893179 [Pavlovales sp. CCMP2436]